MNETRFRDQVVEAIKARGWNMRQAARNTGVSYDVIRELHRRPDSSTSYENAQKLGRALDLIIEDPDGNTLGVELKSFAKHQAQLQRVEPGEAAPSAATLVPVYDVAASAGHGAFVEYEAEAYSLAFPPAYLRKLTSSSPGNLAIISVKGESMEPTLLDDDIVLLDTTKTNLSFDGLFVLKFDDALHVKRIGRSVKKGHVMVISDNRELYPPMDVHRDELEPVGKVLWYGRKV